VRAVWILVALVLLAAPGCGVGPGESRAGGAELRVTRDFGRERLASATKDTIAETDTVMRFLRAERRVETRYGGAFVQSIDDLKSTEAGGRRDWFYWVNGLEAAEGAAEYELSKGDVVQWDHRRWEATMRVPAIVGAYPEPFLNGVKGKRIPTRVECDQADGFACKEVLRRLAERGVTASLATLGAGSGAEVARVLVAPFTAIRRVRSASILAEGPRASGVFARFVREGTVLELLDDLGRPVRSAPPGTGLLAATAPEEGGPLWMVTGVDAQGVEAAARALDPVTLRDAFAVAVTPDGAVRLPLEDGAR